MVVLKQVDLNQTQTWMIAYYFLLNRKFDPLVTVVHRAAPRAVSNWAPGDIDVR